MKIFFNTIYILLIWLSTILNADEPYVCIDPKTYQKKLVFELYKNDEVIAMLPDRTVTNLYFQNEGKVKSNNIKNMGDVIGEYKNDKYLMHVYYNSFPKSKNTIGVVWIDILHNTMTYYPCQK